MSKQTKSKIHRDQFYGKDLNTPRCAGELTAACNVAQETVRELNGLEWVAAVEAAETKVKLANLRRYLRPILAGQAKNLAGISDFEAIKRSNEMLRHIEEETDEQ